MLSQSEGQLRPADAATDVATARSLLGRLEAIEAESHGIKPSQARVPLAHRLRVLPGTLLNIRKRRIKVIPHWLMARIRAELINALQHEAVRLEQEIHLHRQIGTDPREDRLVAAQARLVEARQILRDAR